jgi:hypothetical protein
MVSWTDVNCQYGSYQGENNKMINDALPPIDWKNSVFSEFDDRTSLFNKVYMSLSWVLNKGYHIGFVLGRIASTP